MRCRVSLQRAGELSTGQGQRLLIALAIMHKPAVLLADEATSALDAITQAAVLRLFVDLNRRNGTAMLFISHDLLSVASIGHRVDILHEGRIVESGSPDAIFRAPQHPFLRKTSLQQCPGSGDTTSTSATMLAGDACKARKRRLSPFPSFLASAGCRSHAQLEAWAVAFGAFSCCCSK